jgi:hypothetical protein
MDVAVRMFQETAVETTLAGPRPVIATIMTLGFVVCGTLSVLGMVSSDDFAGYVAWSTAIFAWLAFAGGIATSRIVADQVASTLVLRNMFFDVRIPVEDIRRVRGGNGVRVETKDGRKWEATSFGSSLLQVAFSSGRFRDAAKTVSVWAKEQQWGRELDPRGAHLRAVTWHVRSWWFKVTPLLLLTGAVIGFTIAIVRFGV